jgi:hypothetical protein
VHQGSEQLHGLRHAFRKLPDLPVGGFAKTMLFQQFAPAPPPFGKRHSAQRAHKGDRLIGFHGWIKPALLGQIADRARNFVRIFVAKHAAQPFVGFDNAQDHAQRGSLARAIGAENAVNRTFGHGKVDTIHRQRSVETFDQPAHLDGKRAGIGHIAG